MEQTTSAERSPMNFSELRDSNISPTPEQFLNSLRGHINWDSFDHEVASDLLRNFGDEPNLSIRVQVVECCIDSLENQMEAHKVLNTILWLKFTLHEGEYDEAIDWNRIDKDLLGKIDITRVQKVLYSVISTALDKIPDSKVENYRGEVVDAWKSTFQNAVELLREVSKSQSRELDSPSAR